MNDFKSLINSASAPPATPDPDKYGLRPDGVLTYSFTIMVGAFLLFQVQLIISKYILPWFGGAPSVWTTCNLVFQVLLLIGYLYAHVLVKGMPLKAQVKTHVCLIWISLFMLMLTAFLWPSPITPGTDWRPENTNQPAWNIIGILAVCIGFPFFILSTTSPLLQAWFGQTRHRSPYRLFALSNAGSLLGLLSYPFIIEPNLSLNRQSWIWSAGYAVYILIATLCAIPLRKAGKQPDYPVRDKDNAPEPAYEEQIPPGIGMHLIWLLLAACACTMYLATTNMICQEISVIPFLWVLPLSLYLMSFIACFESDRWYRRGLFLPLYAMTPLIYFVTKRHELLPQIGGYSIALLVISMICHGELARLRPSSRYLTQFYLMVACGGAVGGVFVALIAPIVFPAFWELQIALFACGVLLFVVLFRDTHSWLHRDSFWPLLFLMLTAGEIIETCRQYLASVPVLLYRSVAWGIWGSGMILVVLISFKQGKWQAKPRCKQVCALGVLVLMGVCGVLQMRYQLGGAFIRFRSFFGAFRVEKSVEYLTLKHGTTNHGWQLQDGTYDSTPTSYYTINSGIGILLWDHPKRSVAGQGADLRVGVVGLGVGTLAAYGRIGDYYCFYEIDPGIVHISQGQQAIFTYLENSQAEINVVLGDARISMEREAEQGQLRKFDVLVLDAFNSDSIPVHLMTSEAMEIYLTHLRDQDSVVAFHISNRVLDLLPVLKGLSRKFNLAICTVNSNDRGTISCWVLLCRNPEALRWGRLWQMAETPMEGTPSVLWTDDNNNLFHLVKKGAWW